MWHVLSLYRDHRKLFVGDARGRVFSWSVADTLGQCYMYTAVCLCVCSPYSLPLLQVLWWSTGSRMTMLPSVSVDWSLPSLIENTIVAAVVISSAQSNPSPLPPFPPFSHACLVPSFSLSPPPSIPPSLISPSSLFLPPFLPWVLSSYLFFLVWCFCRCSDYQSEVPKLGITKKVRVCQDCYERERHSVTKKPS